MLSSTPYQLFYWPIPGRAEATRVALSLANLSWEDVPLDREQYSRMRYDDVLPWGMVPLLRTPDGDLAESVAMLRYVGHQCGLMPDRPFMAAKVDEFIDGISPYLSILDGTFDLPDVEARTQARKALFLPGGKGTVGLRMLEKKLLESTTSWIAGTKNMSIADLMVFTYAFGLFSGNFDGIQSSVLSDYPALLAYHDHMANEPRILAHYANLPEGSLRWTYQPGAFGM